MSGVFPNRVRFFERQLLRAVDFSDEQAYHLQGLRRHNLAGHEWGILHGLEVVADAEGRLSVQPGVAVDGYGRVLLLPQYQSLPQSAFKDRASDRLEVWLLYNRRAGVASAASACDTERQHVRETEIAQVLLRAPDRNISSDGRPDARQPFQVPEEDRDFAPYEMPPDDPARIWPVYLGMIQRTSEETVRVDMEGRPYAGLVGQYMRSPSGRALLQLGAGRANDNDRFAVYLDRDPGDPSPFPDPLQYEAALAISDDGTIKLTSDTWLYGDLTVDGGAVEFKEGAPYKQSKPWRFYRTLLGEGDPSGLTKRQLRIELPDSSENDTKGRAELVIGRWTGGKFKPCLTVGNDCSVTVSGNLEVQGSMDVKGNFTNAANIIEQLLVLMRAEAESGSGPMPIIDQFLGQLTGDVDKFGPLVDLISDKLQASAIGNPQARTLADRSAQQSTLQQQTKQPQDFQLIPGIGKVYARRLQDAGVRTYTEFAALDDAELDKILERGRAPRPDYSAMRDWISRDAGESGAGGSQGKTKK